MNRRDTAALLLTLLVCFSGCGDGSGDELSLYLSSPSFRLASLEESLVSANGYAELRQARYASTWSELPEWNPPSRPVVTGDIGAFVDAPSRATTGLVPVFDREAFDASDHDILMALGRRAFETYPMGVDEALGSMVERQEHLDRVGLWTDARGRVGGLVRLRVAGGGEAFAPTCATCHARVTTPGGRLEHGPANVAFDYGSVALGRVVPSRWAPGQLDVTADDVENPVAIGDLRPLRLHRRLHRAGTIRNGLIPLAIRIETLLITEYDESLRPPREVALALAYYVWNMADEPNADPSHPGAAVYATECAVCHGVGVPAVPAVDLASVGTDPRVGSSRMRGTGQYRVPSLVGVLDRDALLNRGERVGVRELLNESGLGHEFAWSLSPSEKDSLVGYLATW